MESGQGPVVMVIEQASTLQVRLAEALGHALASAGVPLLIHLWGTATRPPPALARALRNRPGAVVVTALRRRSSDRELNDLLDRFPDVPRLLLGVPGPGCSVRSDNRLGMRLLADHLVRDCQVQRVLVVRGHPHHLDSREREEGLRAQLQVRGLPAEQVRVVNGRFERGPAFRAVREVLRRGPAVDAVVALNDSSALGALDAALELGLRVPDDLVVTGYDDEDEVVFSRPPLTSVQQDLPQQAAEARKLLLRLLAGDDVVTEVRVPGRLRVRVSSARGTGRGAVDRPLDAEAASRLLWDRITGVDVMLGINRGMVASSGVDDLVHRLASGLPRLAVARAFLVLREPEAGPRQGVLVLAHEAGQPPRTVRSQPFELGRLLPDGDVRRHLGHGTLTLHPLTVGQTELGYLLIDLGGADPRIGEALRTDVSRALEIIRSTKGLRARSRQLEAEVSYRRAVQDALVHQATHDALTGLLNRTTLLDRADAVLARYGGNGALILVDLHRFKDVNDALGHAVGDGLLGEIGRRLTGLAGDDALVARLAGDEFAILVPGPAGQPAAAGLAGRIVAALRERVDLDGLSLEIDGRVGIAFSPQHARDAATLLRMADVALHSADEDPIGIGFYDPCQQEQVARRLALFGELRRGLANQEFSVHYQPIVTMATGQVSGVEALVRWRHPTGGLLLPGHFIDIAEQTGLIDPLTTFVLDQALRDCRHWRDRGMPLKVAVNLSARRLTDESLPQQVASLLGQHEVPSSALALEITESAVMADPERALGVLRALRTLGTDLAVDDFGTGHASLAYLTRLPVTAVKIDRSFVQPMESSSATEAIVRSILRLASDLGLEAIAEGVETGSAYVALRSFGCALAQGFWLARPAPAAEVPGLVTTIRDLLTVPVPGLPAPRRPGDVVGRVRRAGRERTGGSRSPSGNPAGRGE